MMAHSVGVEIAARMEGGLLKGLKRGVLGGESLFVSTYTAPPQGGWVDVAAKLPGDRFRWQPEPADDAAVLGVGYRRRVGCPQCMTWIFRVVAAPMAPVGAGRC